MQVRAPQRRPRRRARTEIVSDRAGKAGFLASIVIAIAGVLLGASVAYLGADGTTVEASPQNPPVVVLRETAPTGINGLFSERSRIVDLILSGGNPERFAAPSIVTGAPRIIIIFDDMGLDRAAFEEVMRLPGPVTFSFLPYAKDSQPLVERARARGDAVLLHLPMEPEGLADPGPHSLKTNMTATLLLSELAWNLDRITGYIGVNNHMGSKLTRDEATMKTVLSVLDEKGLFFLDSLTTGKSVAAKAGADIGVKVYARDVFLDPSAGKETVRAQLAQVERIAVETGYAVAICHPRRDTLDMIGPWLTSAPARGFKLETVAALEDLENAWRAPQEVATIEDQRR